MSGLWISTQKTKFIMMAMIIFLMMVANLVAALYTRQREKSALYLQMVQLEQGHHEEEIRIRREYEDKLTSLLNALIKAEVKVTAYTPSEDETDSTPFINAMNKPIRYYTIGISPDLEALGFTFNRKALLEDVGVIAIEDRMNPKWKMTIDICVKTKEEARQIGKKIKSIMLLPNEV